MEGLVAGRIVYFVFDTSSANEVNRRRKDSVSGLTEDNWPRGAMAHVGNEVRAGDVVPAMVVRVWDQNAGTVNLKVMLDGSDLLWATSVTYAEWSRDAENLPTPRTWHWMYQGQPTRGSAR